MTQGKQAESAPPTQKPKQQKRTTLRDLERRDWWLWWSAFVVNLLLTAAVISFALRVLDGGDDSFSQLNLGLAVRGLVGLVLLFNLYTFYQQILIKRFRRQLAGVEMRAQELQELALLDPLTGLYNRRVAEQRLPEEVARSKRSDYALTVLLLDLNDFKQINDRYGHFEGDVVLKEFAKRLQKAIRFSDVPLRLGGDEFMVLLPECGTDEIQLVLGRLVPLEVALRERNIPVTFAAGWATHQRGGSPKELLERADQMLYKHKNDLKARRAGEAFA